MSSNENSLVRFENREWLDSFQYVLEEEGEERARSLIRLLQNEAQQQGVIIGCPGTTPYINTIPVSKQPPYPGSREIERRIKSLVRWNAMAMVVRANREADGIGGHISTYASQATLFEVAFNHFLRAASDQHPGDVVYFQGHASPGIYARAYLEGRLSEKDLHHFRRELSPGGGLSSYPHPWLMPEFWQFPSVSMGLAPIMAIYQARFIHYLRDRKLMPVSDQKVWAFLGDGEMDEPESKGALTLAASENLDNLIFVINCNLQRLDGPVRGNGKIIQELEAAFRGARWNVIKVIWGSDWDDLLEKDEEGVLVEALNEVTDGEVQKFTVEGGEYIRKHFFQKDPRLEKLVSHLSDEQLGRLRRGGHDPEKVYAAYARAMEYRDGPTVILAQTIKGYGLGEAGEGKNITHQQKKLNEQELLYFRSRFGVPLSDDQVADVPFYHLQKESEEYRYLHERRKALGGYLPKRADRKISLEVPGPALYEEFLKGSGDRELATTMAFVHLISKLLKDRNLGKRIVPIIPDEARTFGMESLFRQVGIYSHVGQLYEPVDAENLLYYREIREGAVLEEGITEAGCMSSFIAAGTSYATHKLPILPFFLFYSMFGFQRIGDLIWAAGDSRARGFMVGAISGRTSLPGEGLQHTDGHSHVLAYALPNLKAYDPAYAYEIAVIVREGIRRMIEEGEDWIYYLTVMNEIYRQPAMPKGVEEGILRGIYRIQKAKSGKDRPTSHLFGSGALLNEAIRAARILEDDYNVASNVWSVTSYKELYRDATDTERWNRLHPDKEPRKCYLEQTLGREKGVFVAASDYLKMLPASIARWIPGPFTMLGTDGYGRSDTREALRDFFEVDYRHIVLSVLHALNRQGQFDGARLKQAIKKLKIKTGDRSPVYR